MAQQRQPDRPDGRRKRRRRQMEQHPEKDRGPEPAEDAEAHAVGAAEGPLEQPPEQEQPSVLSTVAAATGNAAGRLRRGRASKQVMPPANQVITLVPLNRLVPVQPVDVREFPDWQSLRSYVSSYAQITNQLYFVQSAVPVAVHNAALIRSGSSEPQVPDLFGEFSQVFGCIHGSGPQHFAQCWGNTQCPAQIKAHVVRDWHGQWRVVVSQQFAFHNHYVHQELIEQYARSRAQADSAAVATAAREGPSAELSQVVESSQAPYRSQPSSRKIMPKQKQQQLPEPTEIEKLDHNIEVPGIDQFVFIDWREFRAFLTAYGKNTFQHFKETESESVITRNEMVLTNAKDDASPPLAPERFGTYSILFRCIHHKTDIDEDQHVLDTQCPALIIVCLKRDKASGAWHVTIGQQDAFHNHHVNASLYALASTQAAGNDAEVIDLTEDLASSDRQQHDVAMPTQIPPESSTNAHGDADNRNELRSEDVVDDDQDCDLGRCESNDEATEIVQLDHLIRVPPMQQRAFPDWNSLADYIAAYGQSTLQLYSVRCATPARLRNANIMKLKHPRLELLIPEHYEFYVKAWQCAHSNRPRQRSTGKRPNQQRRTIHCPAQITACAKRKGHSGVWEVVITKQVALHNHHINKKLFKSCYVENRRITDPALLNGIMRLHFQGIKCKQIMEYIRERSDIEPQAKDIHNLIRKLVQEGWTADRCVDDVEELANDNQVVTGAEDDESRSDLPFANSHGNRPRIDPAQVLSEVENLARAGASGQQILEFISRNRE